jgi:hypothetical protein
MQDSDLHGFPLQPKSFLRKQANETHRLGNPKSYAHNKTPFSGCVNRKFEKNVLHFLTSADFVL